MFAFTGLNPAQVDALTSRHHVRLVPQLQPSGATRSIILELLFHCLQVFLTRDGRISIAGLNDANVGKLADAIRNVVTDAALSAL
jgi:aspartate/tyrosine/aromatic aminotransferase